MFMLNLASKVLWSDFKLCVCISHVGAVSSCKTIFLIPHLILKEHSSIFQSYYLWPFRL